MVQLPLKKINWYVAGLIGIVLFGFVIRAYAIDTVPFGFFCDEASVGYNAYTILTTGKDEYGTSYPIFFRAFGEYKGPIEIYSTVPFIALLGLTETAVRLTSAVWGTLSIIALYFLLKEVFKKDRKHLWIALIGSAILTITPWHIHFSRVALEGLMPYLFFTMLGLLFFFRSKEKPYQLFFSIAFFAVAFYSYFPARIFIPLFAIGLVVIYVRFFLQHIFVTASSSIFLILLLLPFLQNIFNGTSLARWQQVSIFANPPKQESVTQHIVTNYVEHFSLDFLFTKGDIGMTGQFITRHSVKGFGEFYAIQLLFILFGLVYLYKKDKRLFFLLGYWLLIYPTGSMLTTDQTPQATRSIIGIIPFTILTAVGIMYVIYLLKGYKKYIPVSTAIIVTVLFIVSFMRYLYSYFTVYPLYSSDFWGWQYGPKEIVRYFASQQQQYDGLYLQGEFNAPEIFLKFYAPHACQKCSIATPDQVLDTSEKQLFAVTPAYVSEHHYTMSIKKKIYYPNGSVAFLVGEIH